jgi:hypothetical protein
VLHVEPHVAVWRILIGQMLRSMNCIGRSSRIFKSQILTHMCLLAQWLYLPMARAQQAKPSMMVFYQLGLPIPLAPLELGVLDACNSGLVCK